MEEKFVATSEHQVTGAIVKDFCDDFLKNLQSDVIIVGGGPSGLTAGRALASKGLHTTIIESNNYLGGGFWLGGYLMNGITVRDPAQHILDEIGAPYREADKGLYLTKGPHVCSKLIAAACDAGVYIINMTTVDDVVLREKNRVAGVVINWTPVSGLPRAIKCVDPVALEAKIVIDATGHDAVVASALEKHGLLQLKGCGGMWIDKSEDQIVERTGEIHPGLVASGMAVSAVYGIHRMGPTFGSMLLSGIKAAEVAMDLIKKMQLQKKALVQ